ncbi:MAG: Rrf2 family transcriptional regulator [Limnobacter sp.]|nr:Rrf2 family transcriptional regulator [Limnobacter sp.]
MRLTMMTDFALRLLIYVAQRPERLCTIVEVARAYRISEAHLMKVTHQLALDGWIETLRGKGGGMRLAIPPDRIRVGAVVRSVEKDFRLAECFGAGSACALDGNCRLSGLFGAALNSFFATLDACTLADLLPLSDATPTPPPDAKAQRLPSPSSRRSSPSLPRGDGLNSLP